MGTTNSKTSPSSTEATLVPAGSPPGRPSTSIKSTVTSTSTVTKDSVRAVRVGVVHKTRVAAGPSFSSSTSLSKVTAAVRANGEQLIARAVTPALRANMPISSAVSQLDPEMALYSDRVDWESSPNACRINCISHSWHTSRLALEYPTSLPVGQRQHCCHS
eukprot:2422101-Prymnesium_polylepis.1